MRFWFGTGAAAAIAVVIACSDSYSEDGSMRPNDAGSGASSSGSTSSSSGSTSSSSGSTSSSSGSTSDAATPPACDLSKPFGPKTPVAGLTEGASATLTADEKTLYYADSSGQFGGKGDIAVVTRSSVADAFGKPTSAGPFNSSASEFQPSVSPEGNVLFFRRESDVDDHLWRSVRNDGRGFGPPDKPPALVLGKAAGSPYVGPNGSWIYFSAYTALENGGPENYHLYRSAATAEGSYTTPVLLSELKYLETGQYALVISPDERTIYWGADRTDLGGDGTTIDIYMGTRTTTSQSFANLKRVDELSTKEHTEYPTWLSPDGCRLYFTSQQRTPEPDKYTFLLYVASRGR